MSDRRRSRDQTIACAGYVECHHIVCGSQKVIAVWSMLRAEGDMWLRARSCPLSVQTDPRSLFRSDLGLDGGLVARVLNTCLFSSGCPVGCASVQRAGWKRIHWGNPAQRLTTRSAGGKSSHAGACYLCIAWYSWSFCLCSIRHSLVTCYTPFLGRDTNDRYWGTAKGKLLCSFTLDSYEVQTLETPFKYVTLPWPQRNRQHISDYMCFLFMRHIYRSSPCEQNAIEPITRERECIPCLKIYTFPGSGLRNRGERDHFLPGHKHISFVHMKWMYRGQ